MNIHYFQHVPFEGLGSIREWAEQRGHSLSVTKFHEGDKIPSVEEIDWLIVMGGPMSVHDEEKYPWLKQEKEFIQEAIEKEKTIIGVCLGAQLIADILGAEVYPNQEKEIGWFPVKFTDHANPFKSLNKLKPDFTVFHWHGDTFDLPKGSKHLAFSEACRNQAYLYNEKVLGLQYHLETTKDSLLQMISHGRDELISRKYIQSENEILVQQDLFLNVNKKVLFALLDEMANPVW